MKNLKKIINKRNVIFGIKNDIELNKLTIPISDLFEKKKEICKVHTKETTQECMLCSEIYCKDCLDKYITCSNCIKNSDKYFNCSICEKRYRSIKESGGNVEDCPYGHCGEYCDNCKRDCKKCGERYCKDCFDNDSDCLSCREKLLLKDR